MYCFGPHVQNTASKAKSKLNILKSLAGSNWGQNKDIIINTYKSIGRSVLEYGAPIWAEAAKPTHCNKLQTIQNKALRIATGCLTMANMEHLHQETKVLPLKEHIKMLSKQFVAACNKQGHPGRKHINKLPFQHPR